MPTDQLPIITNRAQGVDCPLCEMGEPHQHAPRADLGEESLTSQIDRLATFIMENVPGQPSHSEGAVACAIRIIKGYLEGTVPALTDGVTYLDPTAFVDLGLLQEVNRLFFHPRSLALEVHPLGGSAPLFTVGIWDDRDDPDGMYFADGIISPTKAGTVAAMVNHAPQEVPQ